jgi:hypothetical protein
VTLMIGSEELGKRIYTAWAKEEDKWHPVNHQFSVSTKPRPDWEKLTANEQSVWRNVAKEISGVLADAMGAVAL